MMIFEVIAYLVVQPRLELSPDLESSIKRKGSNLRVFVMGQHGMVGRALLATASPEVTVITANRSELDLTNRDQLIKFMEAERPEAVIVAAAKVGGIAANSRNQMKFLLENLKIQNSVLESAAQLLIPKLIFLGSSCIYPNNIETAISENALMSGPLEKTNEGYAIAKIAGIKLVNSIAEELNLNYFSLMPTNLFGPNDNFNMETSHVPAALMRRFHEAKVTRSSSVSVWGSGAARREFLHVNDLARACWVLIDKPISGEIINIGTGYDVTIREFASLMARVVGYEGEILYDISKPDGTPRKLLDVSKAHSYGWQHNIELEDGLRQTYNWFVDALAIGEVRGY